MWCGLCVKHGTKVCPKKFKPLKVTRSCQKFVFNTKKVSPKTLKEAIRLSRELPVTQIRSLIALLDSDLKLKRQQLSLALSIEYNRLPNPTVHLIAAPKKDEHAYGVSFQDTPRKNTIVSVSVEKELFLRERDRKLKRLWKLIEQSFINISDPKLKRKKLLEIFTRLKKRPLEYMLRSNGIDMVVAGKKTSEVVDDLLKYYL